MYFPPTLCTRNLTNRPYISGLVIVLWTHKEKQFLWKRLYWEDEYLGKDHEVSLGGDGKITSTRGLDTLWMGLGDKHRAVLCQVAMHAAMPWEGYVTINSFSFGANVKKWTVPQNWKRKENQKNIVLGSQR